MLTETIQENMQLTHLTNGSQSILHAITVLQESNRLCHYEFFPFMEIADLMIDIDATETWKKTTSFTHRVQYNKLLNLAFRKDEITKVPETLPVPKTAFKWFRRVKNF